jgi:hypothetical protein
MLRAQAILVTLFTIGGVGLMISALYEMGRANAGVAGPYLVILAAMGALIATVGLSASMIVSAIRDQPR